MDTKWLENFVSLAETRSFSRSAQLRHVTQSAFSRRIQALEAWAGSDLLIAYHHPSQANPLDANRYEMVCLGEEVLAPYSKPDEHGKPLFELPGKSGRLDQPQPQHNAQALWDSLLANHGAL